MADTKLTGLTAITTPTLDDLLYLVDNPGGTPASRKITVANLFKGIFLAQSSNTQTLTGTKTLTDADPPIQFLDPGGATRTVNLPADSYNNHGFWFYNFADADDENLTVTDGVFSVTMGRYHSAMFVPNGATWSYMVFDQTGGTAISGTDVLEVQVFS